MVVKSVLTSRHLAVVEEVVVVVVAVVDLIEVDEVAVVSEVVVVDVVVEEETSEAVAEDEVVEADSTVKHVPRTPAPSRALRGKRNHSMTTISALENPTIL
jgi:hypothetical protein